MIKLNFGCGGNRLDGWQNFDVDCDISKPLPFPDAHANFILAEHVTEHVTTQEAWNFFEECYRVLKPSGVLRVAVPDIERIWFHFQPIYGEAVEAGGHGDGTIRSAVRAAIFEHGHKAAWNQALLIVILSSIGFQTTPRRPGKSLYPELTGVEGHGKVVGDAINEIETSIVEGYKL